MIKKLFIPWNLSFFPLILGAKIFKHVAIPGHINRNEGNTHGVESIRSPSLETSSHDLVASSLPIQRKFVDQNEDKQIKMYHKGYMQMLYQIVCYIVQI